MADLKISALPAATTPLAGTEVLPIVQGGITEQVSVANLTAGRAVSMLSLTANTTTLVVDSTNSRVGVGTATPAQRLHVNSSGAVAARITRSDGTVANSCVEFFNGTQTWNVGVSGSNFFGVNYNNSAIDSALLRVSTAGDVTVSTGNVVMSTSGKGIDFSATPGTGTSELLADYEEGTWTPTDASGAGLSLTGTSNNCFYTKIGNQVTCIFSLTYPSTASAAAATIGGLPFTSKNTSASVAGGFTTYTSNGSDVVFLINSNDTIFGIRSITGISGVTNVSLSTAQIRGVLQYLV